MKLEFNGNTATIKGLTPAKIGAASATVIADQSAAITALTAEVNALKALTGNRVYDLEITSNET